MPRKLWLSAGLLAAGAALLATARFAGATPPSAGIFRVGMTGASIQIDPQLSYVSTGWWLEYATAAKLYNWSDRGSKLDCGSLRAAGGCAWPSLDEIARTAMVRIT